MTAPGGAAGPLSHRRSWRAGVVQSVSPPGVVDLGPGYLEPGLMPVDLVREAYSEALGTFGSAALAYGDDRGALPLRAALAARVAEQEGHHCGPEQILVTAGTSHALHLIATRLAAPGATVFTERTSYDLGRRIFTDCGLRPYAVPTDANGMDPHAFRAAVVAERARGAPLAFACLTPTFHNPTGVLVPPERRRELLAVAADHDLLVLEDDAYAELGLEGQGRVRSLAGLAGYRRVIRLCTFSKTLAPGLRLGWLLADGEEVDRLAAHGLFASGGSANHLASLAVATLIRSGGYDRHLAWLRDELRARRDALADALRAGLGAGSRFELPAGGFFLWLTSSGHHREHDLIAAAETAGVVVAAGSRFGSTAEASVRLAYSFNPPERLAAAGTALADALTHERIRS